MAVGSLKSLLFCNNLFPQPCPKCFLYISLSMMMWNLRMYPGMNLFFSFFNSPYSVPNKLKPFHSEVLHLMSTLGDIRLLFLWFFLHSLFLELLLDGYLFSSLLSLHNFFSLRYLCLVFLFNVSWLFLAFLRFIFYFDDCIFSFHELSIVFQLLLFHSSLFWFK